MSDCRDIDSLVTPYVDGELPAPERADVERHLHACAVCRSRVAVERSMHELVNDRRPELCCATAPSALLAQCERMASPRSVPRVAAPAWRSRTMPIAIAATLLIAVAGTVMYRLTQTPVRLMAAELTADHLKCFILHGSPDRRPAATEVERSLEAQFNWDATLPAQPERAGLELVGARPCLYAEGRVAHILYRFEGRPVSVFMLPNRESAERLLEVMGHRAVVWSSSGRTFVLVAREPPEAMERLARFVHEGLR